MNSLHWIAREKGRKSRPCRAWAALLVGLVTLGMAEVVSAQVDFFAPKAYPVGILPHSVAVGDFNGDGRLDLVTANLGNSVSVLLGQGDGTFQAVSQSIPVDGGPQSIAAGDFNSDGRLDLATANILGTVSVLLGQGDGTFQAVSQSIPVDGGPQSIAAGDFNRDGQLDLVTASSISNTVSVLLGRSDGTFGTAVNFPVGKRPVFAAVGDFNNDGRPDLATVNSSDYTVSVLLNDPTAIFRSPLLLKFELVGLRGPIAALVAASTGTGKRELLVASRINNALALAPGNGDGTFGTPQSFDVNGGPGALAVADFDGNDREDVAVAKLDTGQIGVLLRNVDGVLTEQGEFTVGGQLRTLSAGDLNHDGKPDLAALGVNVDGVGEVAVWLGNGDGTFDQGIPVPMGMQSIALMLADVNSDERLDLLVANKGSGDVSVALGNGDGTFHGAIPFAAGTGPRALAVGHFNDDAFLDLVVANFPDNADGLLVSSVALLLGNGNGTFQEAAHFGAGGEPGEVIFDDFDGDRQPDLAVASLAGATVSVLRNTTDLCTDLFTAADHHPPSIISITASPNVLWPPNHKLVAVSVRAAATDACDAAPVCRISAVSSNEPINGTGNGDTAPDWQIAGPLNVKLRAERAGMGHGRLYTVEVMCEDAAGNTAIGDTTVSVPKNQR